MNSGRIFVCLTCSRYSPAPSGEPSRGEEMVRAVKRAAAAGGGVIAVRSVECLNGCPNPCTAALRTSGKNQLRFSHLIPEDAPALIEAAMLYTKSGDGSIPIDSMPLQLRGKLSDPVEAGSGG